MKRPAATLLIVGSTLFMVLSGLAAVVVVTLVLTNLVPLISGGGPLASPPTAPGPSASPVPGPTEGTPGDPPPDDGRLADYTFGHTAGALPSGGPGVGVDITQRIPFVLSGAVTSVRLHVRNWSYIDDKPLPGSVSISGIALGRAQSADIPGDSSAFDGAPTVLSPATTLTDGAEFVSDWVGADSAGFEPGHPSVLSIGFSTSPGTLVGVAGNVGWLLATSDPAAVSTERSIGTYTMAGTFLDMWLEYTSASSEKLIVVAGHSLNSGANADAAEHPHAGESSSWHQLWSQQNDGAAASLSTPGSWTVQFGPDSPKWQTYAGLRPDAFVLWSASNDIAGGEALDVLKTAWQASLATAKKLWPDARVFVFTEPGRGLTGEREQNRQRWNEWLKGDTSGAFTVVDADAVLSDPVHPNVLKPSINGDDAHPTPAGNALVAAAFECAFEGC